MSYEDERRLRARRDAASASSRGLTRSLTRIRANEQWAEGRRDIAVVVLHDAGWSTGQMLDFLRAKGLTNDEAADLIRDAPTNPL